MSKSELSRLNPNVAKKKAKNRFLDDFWPKKTMI